MKLKTLEIEGKNYAEVQDDKPLYIEDDGKEVAFDAIGTKATIERVIGESTRYKERAQTAENSLKSFEGIDDPKKALEALQTVSNLDTKALIDAGEVEKVKSEMKTLYEEKLKDAEKKASTIESQYYDEKIGGSFTRSKFISDKLAVPADVIQSMFGKQIKIEDGKTVGYDKDGSQIRSRTNPAELASFDEVIETLIDAYPHKDKLLKGNDGQGSGAQNSNNGTGARTMPLSEFNALDAKTRAAKMAESGFSVTEH